MNKLSFILTVTFCVCGSSGKYEPNWKSLDTRPLPKWYDDAKIGIFIHWGVFSVPSFGSEWFWSSWKGKSSEYIDYMKHNYPETFTYQEFAKDFKAEFFDANEWANIFADSGARYIVLTSKHHEGYTLWPSKYSYSWNSLDVGPGRDVIDELSKAVRSHNLTFGLYHSLYEWFNPMYGSDKASNFTKQIFVNNKMIPEMMELINNYQPSVLWSDGDWEAPDTYWKSTEFLAWLYNDSPVKDEIVTNDRWGMGTSCKHGDIYSCKDRYNPGTLQKHKWENAMTIDKQSWGFRRNAKLSDFFTIEELLSELASTISCGGNLLMNVGPTKDGIIAPIFQERLQQMGQWLKINGEAIYGTKPWIVQNDTLTSAVWYTSKDSVFYAISLKWPKDNILSLKSPLKFFRNVKTVVNLLGNEEDGILKWTIDNDAVNIRFPDMAKVKSKWAYVLKIVPN
ncbi:unnamed protein product [Psylliodes chrysocephalus]|uniref:Putative alpha-L-fucosidase n=1 Tax=Psylliodes chrysocephalus TaxID=3402493 RepID=A0A9P0CKU7_9CUCU|nr:unnamed protein product [Psylliodes chrysocephala]